MIPTYLSKQSSGTQTPEDLGAAAGLGLVPLAPAMQGAVHGGPKQAVKQQTRALAEGIGGGIAGGLGGAAIGGLGGALGARVFGGPNIRPEAVAALAGVFASMGGMAGAGIGSVAGHAHGSMASARNFNESLGKQASGNPLRDADPNWGKGLVPDKNPIRADGYTPINEGWAAGVGLVPGLGPASQGGAHGGIGQALRQGTRSVAESAGGAAAGGIGGTLLGALIGGILTRGHVGPLTKIFGFQPAHLTPIIGDLAARMNKPLGQVGGMVAGAARGLQGGTVMGGLLGSAHGSMASARNFNESLKQ